MADSERSLILIDSTKRAGALSGASVEALKRVAPGRLSLGSGISQYKEENILLIATLIDDSSSLNVAVERNPQTNRLVSRTVPHDNPKSNAEAVRIGHNIVISALQESENPSAIWFHSRYLKGFELNPWNYLANAKILDRNNYRPNGGTPLYDETAAILGSTIAKSQEFRNRWVEVRTALLLVTDGEDTESKLQTPASVRSVITDMYGMGIHIIAAMGIDDGKTDFRRVFIEMGIRKNLILTPGSTPDEIRKAFGLFGRMASHATKHEQFGSLLEGGFLALPPGER